MQKRNFKPTGIYKTEVRRKHGQVGLCTKAMLHVSMKNPKHTADKLFAVLEWMSFKYSDVTVLVSDTLYRHNYSNRQGANDGMILATSLGDKWIEDNEGVLGQFDVEILRWEAGRENDQSLVLAEGEDFDRMASSFIKNTASYEYLAEEVRVFGNLLAADVANVYAGTSIAPLCEEAGLQHVNFIDVDFVRNKCEDAIRMA